MLRNKKADVSDGIILLVTIFFLAVAFIVVAFVNNKLHDVVTTTALNQTEVATTVGEAMNRVTTNGINQGFALIFGFLIIGTMLSAFLVRVHPAFLFLYIIFAGITVFVAVFLANAYSALINNATISGTAVQQTMINWVMAHIIHIMIGTIALSVIILFAKAPEQGGPF